MKHFKNVLLGLSLLGLIAISSCGKKKNPTPDPPGKLTAESLAATAWAPVAGGVRNDGTPRDEWANFRLTFTANANFEGGTYTTTGLPAEDTNQLVWKSNGTWEFKKNGNNLVLGTIVRNDGVEMNVTVNVNEAKTAGTLSLSFTIPEAGARIEGFTGPWVFNFAF
jgi:hypothetical protein